MPESQEVGIHVTELGQRDGHWHCWRPVLVLECGGAGLIRMVARVSSDLRVIRPLFNAMAHLGVRTLH